MNKQILREKLESIRQEEAEARAEKADKAAEDVIAAKAVAEYYRKQSDEFERAERMLDQAEKGQSVDLKKEGGYYSEVKSNAIWLGPLYDNPEAPDSGSDTHIYAQVTIGYELEEVKGRRWLRKTVAYRRSQPNYFGVKIYSQAEEGDETLENTLLDKTSYGVGAHRLLLANGDKETLARGEWTLESDKADLEEISGALNMIENRIGDYAGPLSALDRLQGRPNNR